MICLFKERWWDWKLSFRTPLEYIFCLALLFTDSLRENFVKCSVFNVSRSALFSILTRWAILSCFRPRSLDWANKVTEGKNLGHKIKWNRLHRSKPSIKVTRGGATKACCVATINVGHRYTNSAREGMLLSSVSKMAFSEETTWNFFYLGLE